MKKILPLLIFMLSCTFFRAQVLPACFNTITSTTPVGTSPKALTSADFNNDGIRDLAVANFSSNNISVLIGNGSGGFVNHTITYLISQSEPNSILSKDFNGDNKADLAVVNFGLNTVSIFLGAGTGNFSSPVSYTVGGQPESVTSADFNEDGYADLAVAEYASNNISLLFGAANDTFMVVPYYRGLTPSDFNIHTDANEDGHEDLLVVVSGSTNVELHLGTGTGSFTPSSTFPAMSSPQTVTDGDFNGDGHIDVVITNYNTNNITVYMSTGINTYSMATSYTVGTQPKSIAVLDFNGDGIDDMAVNNYGSDNVSVLLGSLSGTLSPAVNYVAGLLPLAMITDDFNNDGKADLALTNAAGTVSLIYGAGAGKFETTQNFSTGSLPQFTNANDFNGDGKMDLVTANQNSNNVSILLGSGTGTFAPKTNFTAGFPRSVTSTDFNGDGKVDLAVANFSSSYLSVLLGTGTGSFMPSVNYTVSGQPESVTFGDFNNDGKKDLVSANYSTNNVSVLLGSGTGTFAAPLSYSVGTNPFSVISTDFNNDGNADLAVANLNSNNVSVLFGTPSGSFLTAVNYPVGNRPRSLTSGDFNNDGSADLAVANYTSNNVSVLLGSPSGALSAAVNYTAGSAPAAIATTDFNNDGFTDLVTANYISSNMSVLLGSGNGLFTSSIVAGTSRNPFYITAADFDGDNKPDIAVPNSNSDYVTILLNKSFPAITVSPSSTVCLGNALTITAGGAATYSWSTGSPGSSISVAPTVNTTYTVVGTTYAGCSNTAVKTISVTAFPLPAISVTSSPTFICSGSSTTLTASGASTYSWSPGSATANITVVAPAMNTTYTVTGTGANNCYNTQTVSISVNPTPTLTVNSGSVCAGKSFTMAAAGAATYTYSSGSPYVMPAATTAYTVTGTSAMGCPGSAVISTVSVQPVPVLTINSGSICAGDSFTINPGGALTYTSSAGAFVVAPISSTAYTITGTNAQGCESSSTSSVTVSPTPTVTVIQNATVCIGSSVNLVASGAGAYAWNTGATTASISVAPTSSIDYIVTGTDPGGCSDTQTTTVTVDNTCADVWPGDVNSDGTADNTDVLELGLHFAQAGPPRAGISNTWQSFHADNWAGTITNGQNVNHSDCNGDGVINAGDTLAIYTNYGLTHAFKPAGTATVNPQLSIVPDQSSVMLGSWGTASIYLGSASSPANNINGLAFTVDFDRTLIDLNNIYIEYIPSFLNSQNLNFRKLDFSNGMIYTATTHTNNTNVSGNGKIAILHYRIKTTLAHDTILNLGLSQAIQSNSNGSLVPLTAGSASLTALGASTGINEISDGATAVYPNPASNVLNIASTIELKKIELLSLTGQVVVSEQAAGRQHQALLGSLAPGIYFISVYSGNHIIKREKIVVER